MLYINKKHVFVWQWSVPSSNSNRKTVYSVHSSEEAALKYIQSKGQNNPSKMYTVGSIKKIEVRISCYNKVRFAERINQTILIEDKKELTV